MTFGHYNSCCFFLETRQALPLQLRQVADASGFDGDFARLLDPFFPPPAEEFGVIGFLIVGNWNGNRRFAHVRVLDQVVVPNLDRDRFRRKSPEENELFVKAGIQIVLDSTSSARFAAPKQSLFAFHDAVGIGTANRVLFGNGK